MAASLSTTSSRSITLLMSSLSLRRARMICCCRWASCSLSAPPSEPSAPPRPDPLPPPGAPLLVLPWGTPPADHDQVSCILLHHPTEHFTLQLFYVLSSCGRNFLARCLDSACWDPDPSRLLHPLHLGLPPPACPPVALPAVGSELEMTPGTCGHCESR